MVYIKQTLIIALLLPFVAFAQLIPTPGEDRDLHRSEMNDHIFRVLLGLSSDEAFSVKAMYERKLLHSFTVSAKAGPSILRESMPDDAFGNDRSRYALNLVASGELRYYFNLRRRIRLEKTTRNFSAGYFSLEPFVRSKALVILNKTGDEVYKSSSGAYINIGFQKQINKTCWNVFFGTRLPGSVYENSVDAFDIIHFGVAIGRAF